MTDTLNVRVSFALSRDELRNLFGIYITREQIHEANRWPNRTQLMAIVHEQLRLLSANDLQMGDIDDTNWEQHIDIDNREIEWVDRQVRRLMEGK